MRAQTNLPQQSGNDSVVRHSDGAGLLNHDSFHFSVASRDRLPITPEVPWLSDLEQQMASYQAQYETALEQVRQSFVLPTDPTVINFLNEHRTIPQILLASVQPLKTMFGHDKVLALRTSSDDVGSQTLYAVVRWPGPSSEVRSALDRFDQEWWLKEAGQAAGRLVFTYELI
jgi:hypothetical protein